MKNKLTDVSIKTMVGQLPKIITQNNESIRNEFDHIYDSSLDTLILPKINASQTVQAWTGLFRNLQTENLDVSSLDSKERIVSGVSHDKLTNRYMAVTEDGFGPIPADSIPSEMAQYAHNAGSICVTVNLNNGGVKPLTEILNNLINDVSTLKQYMDNGSSFNISSTDHIYGASNETLSEPDSFTFENNILFSTKTQLKRMNLPAYQNSDISKGYLYTYYNYAPNITISDEHTASINGVPGSFVNIHFSDNKKKAYYRIILSRKENKFLRISKDELVRLQLVCVANSNEFGTEWDVNTYSVRNPEDLVIERK